LTSDGRSRKVARNKPNGKHGERNTMRPIYLSSASLALLGLWLSHAQAATPPDTLVSDAVKSLPRSPYTDFFGYAQK